MDEKNEHEKHEHEKNERHRVPTRRGKLRDASTRDPFAPLAVTEAGVEDVRARQAAVGERRKYAGPVFEEVLEPAALSEESAEEDIEPTAVAPAPEEEGDENEP